MSREKTATAEIERSRWEGFAVCVAVAALTILDLSKVNVGLPSIEASLHADSSELQVIVAGYALAYGLALVPSGRLGDLHSRKAMFVIGLATFTLTSLFCALAPNIQALVIGRVLQGVAAGIQMPQVLGLIQELFQGAERGRAFGLFGAMVGISTAFGPTLGGLLIQLGGEANGWRLLFWMNIPLGFAAIWFAIRLLPPGQKHESKRAELDLVGIVLLGLATLCLMVPFLLTTGSPSDDPGRWLLLFGFGIAGAAFLLWEAHYRRQGKPPVVDFALFQKSSYRNGLLVAAAYFAAMPAVFLLTTLYLQQGLGMLAVYAGMVTIGYATASAVTAWIGGKYVNRFGRLLVVIGLVIVIVGFSLVLLVAVGSPPETAPWLMAVMMTIGGAGGGFVISPNQTLMLAEVPVAQGGVAGSMTQVGQRVGTAIGIAVATSVYFATIFAEAAGPARASQYHDAFRNGLLVSLGLMGIALLIGVVDLLERRRELRRARRAS